MSGSSSSQWLNNRFEGCLLLARSRDPYRDRDVRILMIPGEFEVVGINDGVDVWLAPVIANPFSVNVGRLLESVRAGTFRPPDDPNQRRRILMNDKLPQSMRPRITIQQPSSRRRIIHV